MWQKKCKRFFNIALLIILIIVSVKYIKLSSEYNRKRTLANREFISCLSVASSFGSNLISSEQFNNYYYNDAMSKIESAAKLYLFTTYNNDQLSGTLSILCTLMKDLKYKEAILKRSNLIYENLTKIAANPEDEQATNNLSKLIGEIQLGR